MSRDNQKRQIQARNVDGTLEIFKLAAIGTVLILSHNTTQSEDGQSNAWDHAAIWANLILLSSACIQLITRAVSACNRVIEQPAASGDLEQALAPRSPKPSSASPDSCSEPALHISQTTLSSLSNAALAATGGAGFSMIAMFGRPFFNMGDTDHNVYTSLLLTGTLLLGFSQSLESAGHNLRRRAAGMAAVTSAAVAIVSLATLLINAAAGGDIFTNETSINAATLRLANPTLGGLYAAAAVMSGIALCIERRAQRTSSQDAAEPDAHSHSPRL